MLRNGLFLLLVCTLWRLHAAIVVDTGTAWLYSLTIGAEGPDHVEDLLFAEQLKDHDLPDAPTNHWDPHPSNASIRGQRVLLNKKFWSTGGPIFVHMGGEAPIHPGIIGPSTTLYKLASEQGAMIVALEHRYYSEVSNPTTELDSTTRELLTVEQALSDAAHYIETLKNDLGSNSSKVIAFGYGYGGNLAAWAHKNYHTIFVGAVASSAPVNATFDFPQYFQKLQSVLSELDQLQMKDNTVNKCNNVLSNLGNGLGTLYDVISSDDDPNYSGLKNDFGLDANQITDKDSALVWAYSDLFSPIGQIAVQNTLYQDVCVPFYDAYKDSSSGYRALQVLYQHLQTLPKLPTKAAWIWQSCRELGLFQSTHPASSQPFQEFMELDVKYLSGRVCTGDFLRNDSMPTTDQIYRDYGGLDIITDPNITFIHGCYDPWSTLGGGDAQNSGKQNCQTKGGPIFVPGCAHAPDFLVANPACPNNDGTIRQIRANVTRWLGVPPQPWDFGASSRPQASVASQHSNARPDALSFVAGPTKGKQRAEGVDNDPACTGLFEVIVKPTRLTVKAGGFAKVRFDVRITSPTVNDSLLVGVEYPESERVFFAKGAMTPRRKDSPIEPKDLEVDDIEGIYWDGVPSSKQDRNNRTWGARSSHSFTTKFLISPLYEPGKAVELYPGACLTHPNGVHYCCQMAVVKIQVKAP